MKIVISVIVVLMIVGTQSVYAQTAALLSKHPQIDYQSGFRHGVSDAQPTTKHVYIWGSGHGFINQTKEFIDGYIIGFCKVAGSDASMDEDKATFWCSDGPSSASWAIGYTIRSGGMEFHRDPKLEAPSKLPRTFYENMSGFEHGVSDAFLTNQNLTTYISQPGHGMENHTQVFNDGYAKGWCSVMGLDHGIEEPYAEFDCTDQP